LRPTLVATLVVPGTKTKGGVCVWCLGSGEGAEGGRACDHIALYKKG
jgi:hypothetical protein